MKKDDTKGKVYDLIFAKHGGDWSYDFYSFQKDRRQCLHICLTPILLHLEPTYK